MGINGLSQSTGPLWSKIEINFIVIILYYSQPIVFADK